MGLVINTNVSALTTAAALNKSGDSLKTSMERLSTGKEINSAADNAAGKAISTNMTKQLNEIDQGINNAKDGSNLLATMDGAASAIEDMTQRMRTLTVQSLNGTYQDTDRALLEVEFVELINEIQRVSEGTDFNGINLIDGASNEGTGSSNQASDVNINVGSDSITLAKTNLTAAGLGFASGTDADGDGNAETFSELAGTTNGVIDKAVIVTATGLVEAAANTEAAVSISTAAAADAALTKIDTALTTITNARTNFGAQTNRLEHTATALETASTNTSAARSQIEDADFAKETTNLARAKVLQNAGIAMLQQANSQTSNVEQLLR